MSDEHATAAPEAPVASDAQPAADTPPAQSPERPTPMKRGAARRAAAQLASDLATKARERSDAQQRAAAQPRVDAGTPEGGRFTKDQPALEPPAESEVAATKAPTEPLTAAADAPAVDSSDEPDAAASDAPAGEFVTIPLADDHPWRARGKTEVRVPADLEREMRQAVNTPMRAQEVTRLQEQNALLEARLAALNGEMPAPFQTDPKLQHLLNDIGETYDADTRALIEAGLKAMQQRHVDSQVQQAMTSHGFIAAVRAKAAERLPVWAEAGETHRLDQLMYEYVKRVDARNAQLAQSGRRLMAPNEGEFYDWIAGVYAQDPRVAQRRRAEADAQAAAERERIRAEERKALEAAEAEKLREAADRHAQRPPSPTSRVSETTTPRRDTPEVPEDVRRQPNRRALLRRQLQNELAGH